MLCLYCLRFAIAVCRSVNWSSNDECVWMELMCWMDDAKLFQYIKYFFLQSRDVLYYSSVVVSESVAAQTN